jgi:hypothetical protein
MDEVEETMDFDNRNLLIGLGLLGAAGALWWWWNREDEEEEEVELDMLMSPQPSAPPAAFTPQPSAPPAAFTPQPVPVPVQPTGMAKPAPTLSTPTYTQKVPLTSTTRLAPSESVYSPESAAPTAPSTSPEVMDTSLAPGGATGSEPTYLRTVTSPTGPTPVVRLNRFN